MTEPSHADRLRALEERLAKAKAVPEQKPHTEEHYSQAQLAWRMVIELVAGLGVGFGFGYGLDWVLGTKPWFMVVFLFLGLAAGVKTMMRSAEEVQRRQVADATEDKRAAPAAEDGE